MYWATLCAALLVPSAIASYVEDRGIHVVKTVTLANGQVIDWIKRDSQGVVASPPLFSPLSDASQAVKMTTFAPHELGPDGTVPVPRFNGVQLPKKKGVPLQPASRIQGRQNAGQHWYCSTSQNGQNYGSGATLSMFKPYVQSRNDFSLLQTAVTRSNVPGVGGDGRGIQTLEAGWINYQAQVNQPHLFTFFTTNGYGGYGDYIMGWNTDYKGWVQSDRTYYPGMPLSPLSVIGGEQHDLQIQYSLSEGNWWLGVNGVWVGYYPGSLFTKGSNSPSETLETLSDSVAWYGEIAQSENALTTTDMGSGRFAADGKGYAAYIRNIRTTDTSGNVFDYDGTRGASVSDPKRYTMSTHFRSGESWGSYIYLGGPGAGGVTGG